MTALKPENIPTELRELDRWLLWRYLERDGKRTKAPFRAADPSSHAAVDRPGTWAPFEHAFAAVKANPDYGLGFVLGDGIAGADLDDCIREERLHHAAAALLSRLDTYTEVSPSGRGVKAFFRAELNGSRSRTRGVAWGGEFEVYDRGRYFCVTGSILRGMPPAIESRQRELEEVLGIVFPPEPEKTAPRPQPVPLDMSDEDLLAKARRAKDGPKFTGLYDHGDVGLYDGDDSRADAALVRKLVFWTAADAARVDRLFRSSALMREKWDSRRGDTTYGELTITRAIERATDLYTPPSARPNAARSERAKEPATPQPEAPADEKDAGPPEAHTVAPFPLDAIPPELARLAIEAAESLPAPPDLIAVPGLGALATEIGNTRVLAVKPGYEEGVRLTMAVVAEPGTRKSPALRYAVKPLEKRQRAFAEEYREKLEAYRRDEAAFVAEEASWRKLAREGKTTGDPPVKPEPPRMRLAMVSDSTWEAIAEALTINPHGVAYVADELTGWVRGMNQYRSGKGADRQHYLSAWSGATIVVNRKGREPHHIERPFITIMGGLTPDVLSELEDERGREDGFLHRVLFSFPEAIPTAWTERGVSDEAIGGYLRLAERLRKVECDEHGLPRAVRFTPAGREAFAAFLRDDHYPATNTAPAILRGPFAKLEAYFARFALLLQCCRVVSNEGVDEDVDEVSVESAAKLVRYFRSHSARVYWRLRATSEEIRQERFVSWVKAQGGEVTLRDVQRSGIFGRNVKVDDIRAELEKLADLGLGRFEKRRNTAGRPTGVFAL